LSPQRHGDAGLPATDDRLQGTAGDQRLETILSTAERLFQEKGYRGVSIRDLAAAVGVKMSSLYYYFESKDDILYRIIKRHLDHLLSVTSDSLAACASEQDHAGRLRALVYSSVVCMIHDRAASSVAVSQTRELSGEQRAELFALLDEFEERYTSLISEGMEAGVFVVTDPVIATYVLLGAVARVSLWFREDGRLTPEEIAELYCAQLIRSLLPG